ncbi:MAG TPA: AAA family ATPase, partial [Aggregatilineales bacterium]|nr:AAA family ATPase [Aggregatilineales bacterium]
MANDGTLSKLKNEMTTLNRIQVKGFKSIREMDLELRPLNVLIGANGAGKSNFIEVFRLLHEIVNERLQYYVAKSGGADRFLHFGQRITSSIFFEFEFGAGHYDLELVPTEDDSLIFS